MPESISVFLQGTGEPVYKYAYEGVSLDEALWTYLLPEMKQIKTATGEEIDIYGWGTFAGEKLEILKRYLQHGIDRLQAEEVGILVIDLGEEHGTLGSKRLLYDFTVKDACVCLSRILGMIAQAAAQKMILNFKGG